MSLFAARFSLPSPARNVLCPALLRLSLSVLALFGAGSAIAGDAAEEQPGCRRPLVVHLDLDAPSAYHDEHGQLRGMDVELLQAIAAEAGCALRWDTTAKSGARILRGIEFGQIDVMVHASITPERERYALFSDSYRDEVIGLYALHSTPLPAFAGLQGAFDAGLQLIGPSSGWYGPDYEALRRRWADANRLTPYKNAVNATRLLFATPKRGDLVLVDGDIFFTTVGRERLAEVRAFADVQYVTPTYFMFSRKTVSNADISRLNRAIRKLRQNGTLARIEARYRPPVLVELMGKAKATRH